MKRCIKKVALIFLAMVLLATLLVLTWVFWLSRFVLRGADLPSGEQSYGLQEFALEHETVEFNQDNGVLYTNNEIIIVFVNSAEKNQIEQFLGKYDVAVDAAMADIGIYKLIFRGTKTYEELSDIVRAVKKEPIVEDAYLNIVTMFENDDEKAEEDFVEKEAAYPDDIWNNDTWNITVPRGANWGMEAVNAPGAWGYLSEMSEIRVGLIDTVPDESHEDISSDFGESYLLFLDEKTGKTGINTYRISPDEHGTHVSGTINGAWNNKTGVTGVMGDKGELYHAAVFYESKDASGNPSISSRYATAYSYLLALKTLIDHDVRVINISQNTSRLIGFAASRGNQNAIDYLQGQATIAEKGLSRIIEAREAAGKSDFVICVAAGNSNNTTYYKDDSQPYGYRENITAWEIIKYIFGWRGESGNSLALYNNFLNLMSVDEIQSRVIVVGAIGIDDKRSTANNTIYAYSDFSNVGSRVDVVAPGQSIYSCIPNGYDSLDGTSMATPHVSGICGLVFACNPNLTGPQVKEIVKSSVTGRFYYTDGYSGLVNAKDAVVAALKTRTQKVERVLKHQTTQELDLCFVIDTTASMGDDIENAKQNMARIMERLTEKAQNHRVAIIDYRDYSSRSGYSYDYPYKIQLYFTPDDNKVQQSISNLELGNGGDGKETVYSALMASTRLDWREDAKKVIIIMGDAAPLDPEPNTGYTYDTVLSALFNSDIALDFSESDKRVTDVFDNSLINVYSIGTNPSSDAAEFFDQISSSTGGNYVGVEDASQVSDAIADSIEQIEVATTVTAKVDFGDALSNRNIRETLI